MWNKIIFIDYDVGSFGNSILALLVTTSQSALGALDYTPVLSSIGDCHKIRKKYKYSIYEYQLCQQLIIPKLDLSLLQSEKYVPIIGHSNRNISTLMDLYPDSNLIRIAVDRHTFAITFLAGCKKFQGYPTLDTMNDFYDDSWAIFDHNECGMVECLAVNFYYYISTVDMKFYKNAIVLPLKDIINLDFQPIIKLFEQKFNFIFDYENINAFVKEWKTYNQPYFEQADRIEQIVLAIKEQQSMDISEINLYEQALIIAFVCFDIGLDINNYPFNDSFNTGWKDTYCLSQLILNTKEINHGKTI